MSIIIKKAQVLIITVFAIIFTAVIVFALLLPILANLRALSETTDSYQALANAEAGLELEILNQNLISPPPSPGGGGAGGGPSHGGGTSGGGLGNWFGPHCVHDRHQEEHRGSQYAIGKSHCTFGKVKFNLNVSTSTDANGNVKLRIDSEGVSGRFHRTLFLTF